MEEALIKRVLPHSLEAEQSVIGSMLMDREAVIAASEIITGSDFYQQQYGIMFDAMVELFNEGKPVDLVTLQDRLKEKDVPPEVSSLDFVRDIMTMVPTSANVKSYANIVQRKGCAAPADSRPQRRLQGLAMRERNRWKIFWQIRRNRYLTFFRIKAGRNLYPSSRLPSMCWKRLRMPTAIREPLRAFRTGFIDLDYKLSGFQPSDFILIAARPSMGKTAFVLNVVDYVSVRRKSALYGVQPGDVQGTAGKPYAVHGVECRFPETAHRYPYGFRLGCSGGRHWRDRKLQADH